MYSKPLFLLAGDQALVVELGASISPDINQRVVNLTQAMEEMGLPGVLDLVPTYRSLLIYYDPSTTPAEEIRGAIEKAAHDIDEQPLGKPRNVHIPTLYGGEYGPDLDFVAMHSGFTRQEVIDVHSGRDYLVYMIGFSPGFPYLGGLLERLNTPRLESPRLEIPAGSVGIAGNQTGIYPLATPGGWRLIGRTPLRLFDVGREPPSLLKAGDYVRFVPVTEPEYIDILGRVERGEYEMPPEPAGAKVLRSDSSDSRQAKSPATQDALEIILPGFLTTVQDRGRYGYQRFGVPVSGAMDDFALRAANILSGNDEEAAGLEISVLGPRIRVLYDTWIAVTGADLSPTIDGETIPRWETVRVSKGSVLSFAGVRDGMRAYLAIAGGIDVPLVIGSRSTYLKGAIGGYEGRALRAGDILRVLPPKAGSRLVARRFPRDHIPSYGHEHNLRVVMGPQDQAFNEGGISAFLSSEYVVSERSDRTGYILDGPAIQHKSGPDIVSDGSPLGAIQVPGDGRPIILLADRGTTGGYAKIGTVISSDISKLAQAMPGDTVTFKKVTVEDAHAILRGQDSLLKAVAQGLM